MCTLRIPQDGITEYNVVSKGQQTIMFRKMTFPDIAYAWFPEGPLVSHCQGHEPAVLLFIPYVIGLCAKYA